GSGTVGSAVGSGTSGAACGSLAAGSAAGAAEGTRSLAVTSLAAGGGADCCWPAASRTGASLHAARRSAVSEYHHKRPASTSKPATTAPTSTLVTTFM